MYYNCGIATAKKANKAKTPFHFCVCPRGPAKTVYGFSRLFPDHFAIPGLFQVSDHIDFNTMLSTE